MVNEGVTFILDAAASCGNIDSYEWDLDNDGEYDDATGVTTTLVFNDDGVYTVGLKVTDSYDASDTDTATVTVNDLGPTAVLTGDTPLDEGQAGSYDASGSASSPDAIILYEWDWNYDSATFYPSGDTGAVQTHTWMDNGIYTVAVRVTDDDGSTDIAALVVTANDLGPTAALTGDATLDEGQAGSYDAGGSASSPDAIVAYEWDWNYNGTTFKPSGDIGPTQSHTWMDNGTYTVAVRVTDDDGSMDIATMRILE
jgi:PKD repeat protein